MKNETVAVHGGYENDPTTKAVAVPIYQTVAYEFDSADHGAALFNLEAEGHRYSRISNPTTAVLERRVAMLEGGVDALCVSSGQAALNYALLNLTAMGTNIVSVPQLYGTTYTLFGHIFPSQGISVRFAESDQPEAIEKLIDDNTRAVFCESVGNPAGNICDIEALAAVARRHGVPLVVDNTVATPILLRPFEYGADVVVHSLTKFMGGHGTTIGGAIVDSGKFPWKENVRRFPMFNVPDASYHGLIYSDHFGTSARPPISRAAAASISAPPAPSCRRSPRSSCCRASRPWRCGSSAMSRTRGASPNSCATIRGSNGSIIPASPTILTTRWRANILAAGPVRF
jgi:O-acetylhomoserine (thiol)-lyase